MKRSASTFIKRERECRECGVELISITESKFVIVYCNELYYCTFVPKIKKKHLLNLPSSAASTMIGESR